MPRAKPKGLLNIAEFCPFYLSLCNMNIALVHTCLHLYCTVSSFDDHTHHGTNLDVVIIFLQVTLCLGNQSLVLGRGFLQCTPYLYLLTDERWSQGNTTFSLPEATEFQSDRFNTVAGFDNIQHESSGTVCTSVISAPVSAGSIS